MATETSRTVQLPSDHKQGKDKQGKASNTNKLCELFLSLQKKERKKERNET
jgi:hypothetical protein